MALVRAATDAAEPEDYTMPRVGAGAVIIDSVSTFLCRGPLGSSEYKANLNFDGAQGTPTRGKAELQCRTPVMAAPSCMEGRRGRTKRSST